MVHAMQGYYEGSKVKVARAVSNQALSLRACVGKGISQVLNGVTQPGTSMYSSRLKRFTQGIQVIGDE